MYQTGFLFTDEWFLIEKELKLILIFTDGMEAVNIFWTLFSWYYIWWYTLNKLQIRILHFCQHRNHYIDHKTHENHRGETWCANVYVGASSCSGENDHSSDVTSASRFKYSQLDCLFNSLLKLTAKENQNSALLVVGEGNPPVTTGF